MGGRFEKPLVSIAVLAEAAKLAIGAQTDADLVRALVSEGLDPSNLNKDVGRWLNDQHQPRYEATLALAKLAGWFRIDPRLRGQAEAAAAARAEDRARRLAAREVQARDRRRSA